MGSNGKNRVPIPSHPDTHTRGLKRQVEEEEEEEDSLGIPSSSAQQQPQNLRKITLYPRHLGYHIFSLTNGLISNQWNPFFYVILPHIKLYTLQSKLLAHLGLCRNMKQRSVMYNLYKKAYMVLLVIPCGAKKKKRYQNVMFAYTGTRLPRQA